MAARIGDGSRAVTRRQHSDVLEAPKLELKCGAAMEVISAHVVVVFSRSRCVVVLLLHGYQRGYSGRPAVVELGTVGVRPFQSRV